MLKTFSLILFLSVCFQGCAFDHKLITAVRHGIYQNLKYVSRNYDKLNEDCWLGVVLAAVILEDAYQNGTQVMDNSSLMLLEMYIDVLKKGISAVQTTKNWVTKYILDPIIWERNIKYKYNTLDVTKTSPSMKSLRNIYIYQNLSDKYPNSDFCLKNIINMTVLLIPTECYIDKDCWKKYYEHSKAASGYLLTHKLFSLQLARARKCMISNQTYELKTRTFCSLIFAEVNSADYYDFLDEMFDLFLEEVLLCGLEGYTEFFRTKWLLYILKSQRSTGCFPPFLGDHLKTRIKRNTNILADGCADHTTGLGAAVLSLYYNFIIKET